MLKSLIRLLSFFAKEVNEIRRQPRRVASLIFGPFLILVLFGAGYQGDQPQLTTMLVVPDQSFGQENLDALKKSMLGNFQLAGTMQTLDPAMQALQDNRVDLVIALPTDIQERLLRGEQPQVDFFYNNINPLDEQWIQYLSYAQVNEINRFILQRSTAVMQDDAKMANTQLSQTNQQLAELNSGLSTAQRAQTQQSIRQAKAAVGVLALNPLLASQVFANSSNSPEETRQNLLQLQQNLDRIDQALSDGTVAQRQAEINQTRDQIAQLEQVTSRLSSVSPQNIVSPLKYETKNLSGYNYDLMTFYVPRVLALLVQHIAVTLGALALVRERLLGAVEIFRVAPVTSVQVVSGKYLGYTLFIGIIAAVLTALLPLINVPMVGDIATYIGVLLVLTLASLGIGFIISVISTSDSQAIQMSMLVLLFSVFFSGFFLPLDNFWWVVRDIANVLPLTHGIRGLQAVMLQGIAVRWQEWAWMAGIAAVAYVLVTITSHYQFRRV